MFHPRPFKVSDLRTLRRKANGSDVVWLHALLNKHLGLPDDQLPIVGTGADDYGPRTEAKVQRFQKLNRIDIGTRYYMDGVVGQHTWEALHPLKVVTFNLTCFPVYSGKLKMRFGKPNLNLPPGFAPDPRPQSYESDVALPDLPDLDWPPSPDRYRPPPEPKLHFDSGQLQIGKTSTILLKRGPASLTQAERGVTEATSLSLAAVFLKQSEKFHIEHQLGPVANSSIISGRGADATYLRLTDVGIGYTLNFANLPGSGKYFNWSAQLQLQVMKSLTDRTGAAAQGSGWVFGNVSLDKDKKGRDILQLTMGSGIFGEGDAPDNSNSHTWTRKVGAAAFLGVTGIIPWPP